MEYFKLYFAAAFLISLTVLIFLCLSMKKLVLEVVRQIKSKEYNPLPAVMLLLVLGVSYFTLSNVITMALDVPNVIIDKYSTVEGKPGAFNITSRKHQYLTINGVDLEFNYPSKSLEYEKYYRVKYLPNSHIVSSYEVIDYIK